MKNHYKSAVILVVLLLIISFPGEIKAQSRVFNLDTVVTKIVGPGVTYYQFKDAAGPWSMDLLKVELNNPYISVESVKSLDKLAAGREKTSAMSLRKNAVGHWSVGGVNGDFFNLTTGAPNGIQVRDGELLRIQNPNHPVVSFDADDRFSISRPAFSGKLILNDTVLTINGINDVRGNDQLFVYNSYFGGTTGTSMDGSEFIVHATSGYIVNDTTNVIVDQVRTGAGNSVLSAGVMVISASGSVAQYLNTRISTGSGLKLLLETQPAIRRVKESIGGHPILVTNGSVAPMDSNDTFVTARHPRTMIGFSQDSSIMYLATVDGRQATFSIGMTCFELADLMIQFGCYTAMNFDGGGSTTLVARSEVMNSPSDPGGERTVSNALLVISNAPLGAVQKLNLSPRYNRVFRGDSLQLAVDASDIYYNPIAISLNLVTFTLSKPTLGTMHPGGLFIASTTPDSGFIYAQYQGIRDSVFVVVKGVGRIEIKPKTAVISNSIPLLFTCKVYDTDNEQQQVPFQMFSWVCTDTTVGRIDALGQFMGLKSGITNIIVTYLTFKDTAEVSVEVLYGVSVIDSLENTGGWYLTLLNTDSLNTVLSPTPLFSTLGENSFKLDYSFTYTSGLYYWVYLNKELTVAGIPDSLILDVRSNGMPHRVFFDIQDLNGNIFRIQTHKLANGNETWESLRGAFPKSTLVVYPVKLKMISIPLGSTYIGGQVYSGTIYLDNLRVKYGDPPAGTEDTEGIPSDYLLANNYPNPFNPSTIITYSLPKESRVKLSIYDIMGREVAVLTDEIQRAGKYEKEFNGEGNSSGVYFYQLRAGEFQSVKKMILLK